MMTLLARASTCERDYFLRRFASSYHLTSRGFGKREDGG
jgi:hypothetical protein